MKTLDLFEDLENEKILVNDNGRKIIIDPIKIMKDALNGTYDSKRLYNHHSSIKSKRKRSSGILNNSKRPKLNVQLSHKDLSVNEGHPPYTNEDLENKKPLKSLPLIKPFVYKDGSYMSNSKLQKKYEKNIFKKFYETVIGEDPPVTKTILHQNTDQDIDNSLKIIEDSDPHNEVSSKEAKPNLLLQPVPISNTIPTVTKNLENKPPVIIEPLKTKEPTLDSTIFSSYKLNTDSNSLTSSISATQNINKDIFSIFPTLSNTSTSNTSSNLLSSTISNLFSNAPNTLLSNTSTSLFSSGLPKTDQFHFCQTGAPNTHAKILPNSELFNANNNLITPMSTIFPSQQSNIFSNQSTLYSLPFQASNNFLQGSLNNTMTPALAPQQRNPNDVQNPLFALPIDNPRININGNTPIDIFRSDPNIVMQSMKRKNLNTAEIGGPVNNVSKKKFRIRK